MPDKDLIRKESKTFNKSWLSELQSIFKRIHYIEILKSIYLHINVPLGAKNKHHSLIIYDKSLTLRWKSSEN